MNVPRRALPALLLALAPAVAAQEPLRTPPDRPVDVTHIDLDLTVDLQARSVDGAATLDVTAVAPVRVIGLDAVDHEVEQVEELTEGAARRLAYAYDGQRLVIERPLERGASTRVRVTYRVREPKAGLHFFGPTPDAPDTPWQVWSQGETTSNRHWFPCLDHPSERQTTSLTARVDPGLTVISNGRLVERSEEPAGGKVAWRFSQEREHVAYLVTLVVGEFAVARDEWRGKPLAYYVPPDRAADIERSFSQTKAMLDFFSEVTGVEYPWPKYDQVVVEQFEWGGMENTGATTLNERTLHDERAHLDYSSEGLVAHELAHQWFGDLVTCRDWAHIWLNESFATYFASLWVERSDGADEFAVDMFGNMDSGLRSGNDRPILDRRYPSSWSVFDGRAYPKGATVLHMLRRQLGEEAWWAGVREHLRRHADTSAETFQLRHAFEAVSGRNLERFFYDWLERPGHPKLDVRLERDAERGLVTVTARQTQEGEAYHLPAELVLRFGDREVRRTLDMTGKEAVLALPEAGAPTWFRFDPREAVLLKDVTVHKPRELWVAQLREDDAWGRIRAARALARDHHPQSAEALIQALRDDPFWGVKAEAAEALGQHGGDVARDALLGAVAEEGHPKVRRRCLEALGKRGPDPKAAEVVGALLQEGDPSYYVTAAAVDAYARAAREPRELLLAQLEVPSHNEVVRHRALYALAALEDPSLIPTFLAYLHPRHDYGVRQTAARCLAVGRLPGASEEQRRQAAEALAGFLAGTAKRGRRAALDALGLMAGRAREALRVVEAVAAKDPEEDLRERARQVAEKIRTNAEPDLELRRLRDELAKLRDSNEELQDRLEKVESAVGEGSVEGGK